MHYLLYKITNIKTKKFLIGKYIGTSKNIKLSYSSNKFLISDIKNIGYEFFKKEIIKEFSNKEDLKNTFKKLVDENFKQNENTYNYKYIMSPSGAKNISIGRHIKESEKLKIIYPNFKYTITRDRKIYYKILNYCKHGDLIIEISKFNKIYNDNNEFYCDECFRENINNFNLNENEIIENLLKLKNILSTARTYSKQYILKTYPSVYKSILVWTKQFENIEFNERVVLAKNLLKNKPKCVCCENSVYFGTNSSYTKYCYEHLNHHPTAYQQKEICEFIKHLYTDIIIENYKIENQEIDIFIPKLNLGFEFNGLYWHSDVFKKPTYHYNKWKYCYDYNIKLISI